MFLSKPVDEELGNQLVATMLYLDSENKKDINLYINCSGGDVSQRCLFPAVPSSLLSQALSAEMHSWRLSLKQQCCWLPETRPVSG